jgi:hypothetical protein
MLQPHIVIASLLKAAHQHLGRLQVQSNDVA